MECDNHSVSSFASCDTVRGMCPLLNGIDNLRWKQEWWHLLLHVRVLMKCELGVYPLIPGQGLFVQYNSCWLPQVWDPFDETTWSSSLVFYVLKKQDSQLWVRMDRGLLRLQDAIQKQETTSVCVKKTAGIGWNTLEALVILRITPYTPFPIVSAVFFKSHNSFTRVSKTSITVLDVWTCIFKLEGMLVNSKASTLCSFPESVTLWLHHFNLNLYNRGYEERNAA